MYFDHDLPPSSKFSQNQTLSGPHNFVKNPAWRGEVAINSLFSLSYYLLVTDDCWEGGLIGPQ